MGDCTPSMTEAAHFIGAIFSERTIVFLESSNSSIRLLALAVGTNEGAPELRKTRAGKRR